MRYRFPYVGADLRTPVLQPGTSEHCEKYALVYHAICVKITLSQLKRLWLKQKNV